MSAIFQHELELVKQSVLSLCGLVEERLQMVVRALEERNEAIAHEVIDSDHEIDEREVQLEEECLKLLALHQPVAVDLRFLVSVLKLNSDLERIGDLAVNCAEHVLELCRGPLESPVFDFMPMGERVLAMVRKSIDALVNLDEEGARQVGSEDDIVDAMKGECAATVEKELAASASPERVHVLLHSIALSRNLERIADHATNIAEDVRYLVEGTIVRHTEA